MANPIPEQAGYTAESLVDASNKVTGDLSAQSMLSKIFGEIANNPLAAVDGLTGAGDILGTIFMFINMGLLTLGGIYLSYKTLAAVTQTAHDGKFMGKAFHSVWVPIRITTGVFALIPIAGGWSILQIAMLWFGIMGAGLGNMAWQGVVNNFQPFKTYTLQPPAGGSMSKSFPAELFKMHVCVKAHNAQIGNAGWGYKRANISNAIGGVSYGEPTLIQFGSRGGSNAECGKIELAQWSRGAGKDYAGAGGGLINTRPDNVGIKTLEQRRSVRDAAQAEFDKLSANMEVMAEDFINGPNGVKKMMHEPDSVQSVIRAPFDPVELRRIGVQYNLRLTESIANAMHKTDALTQTTQAMKDRAQTEGFTTAGAFYMTMAQTSYMMNSIAQNVSPQIVSAATPPHNDGSEAIWKQAYGMVESAKEDAKVGKASVQGGNQDAAWSLVMDELNEGSEPGQALINRFVQEDSGQPVIIRLKNMGDNAVTLLGAVITAAGAAQSFLDESLIGKIAGLTGIKALIAGGAKPWLEMIIFVAQLSMGFFLMCALYLPLVPFIIFMGQVLNWLITVIEGVCAAPFLAFAHLDTDGEGLGHKTQYGYTFMLSSFMRPVMLVLGFVVACILLEVIGGFLMGIFPTVLANVEMDSVTGFFSILGYMAIFMVLMVILTNSAMSVTYLLPDAIFQFIGAHNSATAQVGRDTASHAERGALGGAAISRQGMGQIDRMAQSLNPKRRPGSGGATGGGVRPDGGRD